MAQLPSTLSHEKLFYDASRFFDALLDAFNNAKHSIDISIYIFHCDALGQRLTKALEFAALKGVKVRILVDGVGCDIELPYMLKRLLDLGGELKIYHPLPWNLSHWPFAITRLKGLSKFKLLANFINRRNHQKLIIIDQRSAWLGSYNFSEVHLPKKVAMTSWLDVGIQVSPVSSAALHTSFDHLWHGESIAPSRENLEFYSGPFRFNFSRRLRRLQKRFLLRKIKLARDRIWIMNAYFVPDHTILKGLQSAAARNVDVKLILPQKSDVFFIPWATSTFYEALTDSGVKIFEYQNGILHAKTLIIDDWSSIGSSNINQRSLKHDLECDYNIQESKTLKGLEKLYEKAFLASQEIDPTKIHSEKKWHKLLGMFMLVLIGYWV